MQELSHYPRIKIFYRAPRARFGVASEVLNPPFGAKGYYSQVGVGERIPNWCYDRLTEKRLAIDYR